MHAHPGCTAEGHEVEAGAVQRPADRSDNHVCDMQHTVRAWPPSECSLLASLLQQAELIILWLQSVGVLQGGPSECGGNCPGQCGGNHLS